MAFLDSRRVTDVTLTIPPAGGWLAMLHLDSGAMPSPGAATLKIGDLSLPGRILARGGIDSPARPAVVVAGGDGWTQRLPLGQHTSPTGIRLLTILAALAGTSAEPYAPPPERIVARPSLGGPPAFGWRAGTRGTAILARLVAAGAIPCWRVDPHRGVEE